MKILAIDTTAKTATAALTEDEKLIGLTILNTPNTHSVTLLPAIEELLSGASVTADEIDIDVCSAGPGSFTGVRIGTSTIKGLAYAQNKACIGVSALEALADNITADNCVICPVMDARRGQLYNALFEKKNGELIRLTDDRTITKDDLKAELEDKGLNVILCGDGYDIAAKTMPESIAAKTPEMQLYHNAYSVAVVGYRAFMAATEEERKSFTASALAPVYLRASQAERERNEKLNNNAI